MGVLRSRLFVVVEPSVNEKLEACASGKPTEVASHFAVGARGPHILQVQKALEKVKREQPNLKIPAFALDGIYSPNFAKAVYAYKQGRKIKNYAGKIDDIIGIKTIRSLDDDVDDGGTPLPLPGLPPPQFQRELRITKRVFTRTDRSGGKPASGGGAGDDGVGIFEAIQDLFNSAQDPEYWLGKEAMARRQTEWLDWTFLVGTVYQLTTIISEEHNVLGDPLVVTTTTTEFRYSWVERPGMLVLHQRYQANILGDTSVAPPPQSKTIPREVARKSSILTPPNP